MEFEIGSELYAKIPKDPISNLEFRLHVLDEAAVDAGLRKSLWTACKRDPLFYLNAFVYTHDPRRIGKAESPIVPFITWDFQNEAIRDLCYCITHGQDVLIEKSRDMGASWICIAVLEWLWHFHGHVDFLLVSRKEEYVDSKADPKSLFYKIDFIHENQPGWLVPKVERTYMRCVNKDSGATLTGESTNKDVARGDRKTAILLDEFASVREGYSVLQSTSGAANCCIYNSTPAGSANAFYDLAQNPAIKKIRLHWTQHPIKSRGLYKGSRGEPRSPWYDRQVARSAHWAQVAQEHDINYLGAAYQWFDDAVIDRLLADKCRPPFLRGDLGFSEGGEPTDFSTSRNGPLQLWCNLDTSTEEPPADRDYVIGADIATGARDASGAGSSNSAASVVDLKTREKVAEMVMSGVPPEEFACRVAALARWFGGSRRKSGYPDGAYLIWEANGPGRLFGQRLEQLNYRYVYYNQDTRKRKPQASDIPGFYTTAASKAALLGEYRSQLQGGSFVNYSADAVRECRFYVYTPTGVTHARAVSSVDPSGARENHGDRVIADALACKAMIDRPYEQATIEVTRPNTYAARMHRALELAQHVDTDLGRF